MQAKLLFLNDRHGM